MIATAKLFQNGKSQAVRLPKEFRFEGEQVYIRKVGKSIVLTPLDDPWEMFFEALTMFPEDFMAEGRQQPIEQQIREGLDDLFGMIYLLDSNICVYLIKNYPVQVRPKFERFQFGDISVSSITVAELRVGVERNAKREQANLALDQLLYTLIIMDFDAQAAFFYGKIRTLLEKQGTPIGPLDTLIAAHALSLGVTLVTNNEREFKRVLGLKLENWV